MPERIVAILDDADQAVAAVRELEREGISRASITVMSSEPIHNAISGPAERPKSYISIFGIIGGIVGATSAILLTVLTSRRVDLVTGGMPIVTPWAFGIIVFELTALGAILGTLLRMIYEARLARPRRDACYDEAVADGKVVIAVRFNDDAHQQEEKDAT